MSSAPRPAVGFGKTVALGFDEAIGRVEQALKAEGFGVLTRIDVKATLKEKLGIDREPMVILGACNPPFAHQALEAEPQVGLLMPCNVVVREHAGSVVVEAMNPELMATMFPDRPLAKIANEVTERLRRAIAAV
jgi:uncharacterized protein (DUF302 family)